MIRVILIDSFVMLLVLNHQWRLPISVSSTSILDSRIAVGAALSEFYHLLLVLIELIGKHEHTLRRKVVP